MKHVGLNVAADPLYTASYIGVNGGMVCAVADDPGMHSSQNEQDSRRHAIAAKVPMLEPSDSQEALDFTKLAYELSERFDAPILLRLSTRISHSRSLVTLQDRNEVGVREYKRDVMKNVMMPAMARKAHAKVEARNASLTEWADTEAFELGVNRLELFSDEIGVIAAGSTYAYAREALGEGASYLKLGIVNPLPVNAIIEFAKKVKKIYVIEELDDIIETHCIKLGVKVIGREVFPPLGEYNQAIIAKAILNKENEFNFVDCDVPARPPRALPRLSSQRSLLRA
jgi:indolepyruvate ferredoxin oxidoreductase alpha subunit